MARWWHGKVIDNPSQGGGACASPPEGQPTWRAGEGDFHLDVQPLAGFCHCGVRESGVEVVWDLGWPGLERMIVIRGRVAL